MCIDEALCIEKHMAFIETERGKVVMDCIVFGTGDIAKVLVQDLKNNFSIVSFTDNNSSMLGKIFKKI